MKTPKPGQLCTINNVVYRAKRRTDGCQGCDLNSLDKCPNITDYRAEKPLKCALNDIILKKV